MNLVVLEFIIVMIYTFGRRLFLTCCVAKFIRSKGDILINKIRKI